MYARRLSVPSHVYRQCASRPGPFQRRWARVDDVRFLATHQQGDRITDKYRDKLQRKAREQGLQSVDELRIVYKARIQEQKTKTTTDSSVTQEATSLSPPSPPAPTPVEPHTKSSSSSTSKPSTPLGLRTLSSYLDLDKTLALPPKEIAYIWRLRHASSPTSLCAILPSATYSRVLETARRHPQFILPLPREDNGGAEIHFLQFSFPASDTVTVMFTHLSEYKLRGEFSQPHTTVTIHSELISEKGLALMQGQVVEGRGVSAEDARWLVLCLQKFYGATDNEDACRKRLLQMFSEGDTAFRIEELIEEAEKIV